MPTIKDIARECGVSANTVSCVLNNKHGEVSSQTRERILDAIRRLGYRPNAAARSMVGKRTNTFGIADRYYVSSVANPYKAQIIEPIIYAARLACKDVLYYSGHVEESGYPAFLDGRCDGLICFTGAAEADEVKTMLENGLPIVFIGEPKLDQTDRQSTYIDVDNELGAYMAVKHLIALGHKRIAMAQGLKVSGNTKRTDGYRRALVESGIEVDERLLHPIFSVGEMSKEEAIQIIDAKSPARPTAVFCFNDVIAFRLLQFASELGIKVPEELSVVGFDDIDGAAATVPPLTTVHQPLREIGQRAVKILVDVIEGRLPRNYVEIIQPRLTIRESTALPSIPQ